MANKYTYDDFYNALNKAGVYMSDADMKLAQQNPDAGMSILSYKMDFQNATTAEARALAHQGAENIRAQYGEYSGGKDGSQYKLTALSPNSYNAPDKPTYSGGAYSDDLNNLWNQQMNYGSFSFNEAQPTYTNRYDDRIQAKLSKIENPDPFSYDAATDPLYQQYRKQYTREGQRATADALGIAAAASGGIPSSYAQTAAGQQANYYASQMTDKIPELYQLAYQKYLNDFQMQQVGLSALQTAEQSDYDKYRGELAQYNTNRDFARNIWNDEYSHLANNVNTAQSLSNMEYQQYLDALNQYNIDRNFGYQQTLDEIASQRQERQDALDFAQIAYGVGDNSFYNNLGINTDNDPAARQRLLNEAYAAADMGNYDLLAALGISPDMRNVNNAALAGKGEYYGDGGYYTGGGYVGGGSGYSSGGAYTGSSSTGVDNEGYGDSAIRALQSWLGVDDDGLVGPLTRQAMLDKGYHSVQEAYNAMVAEVGLPAPASETSSGGTSNSSSKSNNYTANPGYTPSQIRSIQEQAGNIAVDEIWGPDTAAAYDRGIRPKKEKTLKTEQPTPLPIMADETVTPTPLPDYGNSKAPAIGAVLNTQIEQDMLHNNENSRMYQKVYSQIVGGSYNARTIIPLIENGNFTESAKEKLYQKAYELYS